MNEITKKETWKIVNIAYYINGRSINLKLKNDKNIYSGYLYISYSSYLNKEKNNGLESWWNFLSSKGDVAILECSSKEIEWLSFVGSNKVFKSSEIDWNWRWKVC